MNPEKKQMKRTTQLFTLTIAVLATIVITLIVSPARATKGYSIEAGDIAFVDVFYLVDKALLVEDRVSARAEFNTKSTETITALNQQLQTLQQQLAGMQQGDPQAANVYQQYQSTNSQLDTVSQQINLSYQSLIAQQIADAYTEIYASANEIGSAQGFSFVFATRSDGELIQTDTITGITQEILARPLMTPPDGVDLTEQVRVKLGYPEKAPEPVVEPVAQDQPVDSPEASEPEAADTTNEETPVQEVPATEDD